jgi:hypothetical protein
MKDKMITIEWGVTVEEGTIEISLEELGCESIDEWNQLSTDEKKARIQNELDDYPDLSVVVVTKWRD